MGYPKRHTLGRINCRPKIFQKNIFSKHSLVCNPKCLYYIFCMAEIKKISLEDRIKQLRLSLQKPYHVFSAMENGEIYLLFENDEGERISFREKTLVNAVKKAEDYLVASKIRAGQDGKLEEQKNPNPLPPPSNASDLPKRTGNNIIETESHVRNSEGKIIPDVG